MEILFGLYTKCSDNIKKGTATQFQVRALPFT